MASWRDSASEIAQDDLDALFNAVLPFAEKTLGKSGEIYPFCASVGDDHIGDAAYGLRKLVDIAERGIASSPYHDPMTTVQAIDRLHDGLRQLCFRQLPSGRHRDAEGVLRLVTRELAWHGYVTIALGELVELSSSSPVVARRLLAALDDLIAVAPAERRPPLEVQRHQLLTCTGDSAIPLNPDVQGLGAGQDLMPSDEVP
jgi:uncharacterized membrane protein